MLLLTQQSFMLSPNLNTMPYVYVPQYSQAPQKHSTGWLEFEKSYVFLKFTNFSIYFLLDGVSFQGHFNIQIRFWNNKASAVHFSLLKVHRAKYFQNNFGLLIGSDPRSGSPKHILFMYNVKWTYFACCCCFRSSRNIYVNNSHINCSSES